MPSLPSGTPPLDAASGGRASSLAARGRRRPRLLGLVGRASASWRAQSRAACGQVEPRRRPRRRAHPTSSRRPLTQSQRPTGRDGPSPRWLAGRPSTSLATAPAWRTWRASFLRRRRGVGGGGQRPRCPRPRRRAVPASEGGLGPARVPVVSNLVVAVAGAGRHADDADLGPARVHGREGCFSTGAVCRRQGVDLCGNQISAA